MLTYDMDKREGETKFAYLYRMIKEDVRSGRLKPLEKLPSKRSFAEHLGVSVLTVENAYTQLAAEGYIFSREKRGFYVSSDDELPQTAPVPKAPRRGESEIEEGDFQFSAYVRIMRQVISEHGACLYGKVPAEGLTDLREAVSAHLKEYRGMDAPPDRIVIGSGAEYLYGLLSQLFDRGTVFGIESPSYEKIKLVYEAHGVKLEELTLGRDGISTDSLSASSARVLHVSPFHSFPTGICASGAKRREYLSWARSRGAVIIEDDFDSEFVCAKKPLETLYSMSGGVGVIYINTFSKSLAPSARLGYMVVPADLEALFKEKLGFYSCTVPAFDQEVLARFISEGHFERHLNRMRRKLKK